METSLHRELKGVYADSTAQLEAKLDRFRIDVMLDDQLVEIQHGSLAAIRAKIAGLVRQHRVLVVKPLVASKRIVRQDARAGRVLGRRMSPKRATILDIFHELVYFVRVFPHPRLILEVPLVEIEEWRYPGHGRRRRRGPHDFEIEDQKLVAIREIHRFRNGRDLADLIGDRVGEPFHTGDLAQGLGVSRWFAQRIAYCLREMRIAEEVGKAGNTRLYRFRPKSQPRAAAVRGAGQAA